MNPPPHNPQSQLQLEAIEDEPIKIGDVVRDGEELVRFMQPRTKRGFRLFDCREYLETGVPYLRCFKAPPLCVTQAEPSAQKLQLEQWRLFLHHYGWIAVVHGGDESDRNHYSCVNTHVLRQLCQAALSTARKVQYLWLDVICSWGTEREEWYDVHTIQKIFQHSARTIVLLNGVNMPLPSLDKPASNGPGTIMAQPFILTSFTIFMQLILSSRRMDTNVLILFDWKNPLLPLEKAEIRLSDSLELHWWSVWPVRDYLLHSTTGRVDYTGALMEFDAYLAASSRPEKILQLYSPRLLDASSGDGTETQLGEFQLLNFGTASYEERSDHLPATECGHMMLRRVLRATSVAHASMVQHSGSVTTRQKLLEYRIWENALGIPPKAPHSSVQFVSGLKLLLKDVYSDRIEHLGNSQNAEDREKAMQLEQHNQMYGHLLSLLPALVRGLNGIRDLEVPPDSEIRDEDLKREHRVPLSFGLEIDRAVNDFKKKSQCCALKLVVNAGFKLELQLEAMPLRELPEWLQPRRDAVYVALFHTSIEDGNSSNQDQNLIVAGLAEFKIPRDNRVPRSQSYWKAVDYKVIRGVAKELIDKVGDHRRRQLFVL